MNAQQAQEQLDYIQHIIKQNRETVRDRGNHYIFWGVLIALSMLMNYAAITWNFSQYLGMYWLIVIAIGWLGSIVLGRSEARRQRSSNYAEKVLSAVWIGMGMSGTLIGVIPALLLIFSAPVKMTFMFICPLMSIILGMAYFITGVIMQFKWLQWVALAWWLGAIALFFLAYSTVSFLLFGVMILALQVVPGVIIRRTTG